MTEKELKKLNRYQLLELLIFQTERADQLEKELAETRKQLEEHNIRLSKLGSIAEASLQLSGISFGFPKTHTLLWRKPNGKRKRKPLRSAMGRQNLLRTRQRKNSKGHEEEYGIAAAGTAAQGIEAGTV